MLEATSRLFYHKHLGGGRNSLQSFRLLTHLQCFIMFYIHPVVALYIVIVYANVSDEKAKKLVLC